MKLIIEIRDNASEDKAMMGMTRYAEKNGFAWSEVVK